ncbi:MAG TPA: DUF4238 domain-containing protein [Solirubrobacterales bacterium]|nr:DUF4238 domain-containing protein [Solirubrobacterales bacterium]
MSEPKRHHYVPKTLLRQWEDRPGSEHVYVLNRCDEAAPRRAHIDDVMVIGHFYTRNRDRKGKEADALFEEILSDAEELGGQGLDQLRADDSSASGLVVPWLYASSAKTSA